MAIIAFILKNSIQPIC